MSTATFSPAFAPTRTAAARVARAPRSSVRLTRRGRARRPHGGAGARAAGGLLPRLRRRRHRRGRPGARHRDRDGRARAEPVEHRLRAHRPAATSAPPCARSSGSTPSTPSRSPRGRSSACRSATTDLPVFRQPTRPRLAGRGRRGAGPSGPAPCGVLGGCSAPESLDWSRCSGRGAVRADGQPGCDAAVQR